MTGDPILEELTLDNEEIRRYSRHLTLPEVGLEGQKRLKASRVLLVGAGGLGSPLGLYLAAAGIGTLGLVDDDRVDLSNLQRQVLYGHSDVGRPKLEAACERLRDVNPGVELEAHPVRLDAGNARSILERYDVIVDGSDNFPTRYLTNDACVLLGKPLVWGAIQRFEGQLSVFWAERGPCYRCLFPEPPPPGLVPTCAEGGVLGVLPGIIGSMQALEAVKLVLGIGESLVGRFLVFDALRLRWRSLKLEKDPQCPVCGASPSITTLETYEDACVQEPETPQEEIMSQDSGDFPFDISVAELKAWLDEGRELMLIDVREPHEHDLCRIDGARLIPMRQLPEHVGELASEHPVVLHCHHGPRSSHAVAYLRQQGIRSAINLAGGIDAWSLEIDPSVPRY